LKSVFLEFFLIHLVVEVFSKADYAKMRKHQRLRPSLKTSKASVVLICEVKSMIHSINRYSLSPDRLDLIDKKERESWLRLRSIVCVEAHRENKNTGVTSVQKRYYIPPIKQTPSISKGWFVDTGQ